MIQGNFKHLSKDLEAFSTEIQERVTDDVFNQLETLAEGFLEGAAAAEGIRKSEVTGKDKLRSKKEQAMQLRYGRSILNWKEARWEGDDATVAWIGSPAKLGYRASYINYGTQSHVRWGKTRGLGLQPTNFINKARKAFRPRANKIIITAVQRVVNNYKPKKRGN